jgi:hypothetical protein
LDRIDPAANQVRQYSIADGMPIVEVLDLFYKAGSGLWVGSMLGLYHLAGSPPGRPEPPPVLISGLRIGGVAYPLPEAGARQVTLPDIGPNQNSVEIAYLGISGAGSALRFRYQLEAGRGWSEATRDRSVVYPRLPPGEYRFSVVAVAPDGAASSQPASVAFRILPPVWQRWWFVTACLRVVLAPARAFAP